MATIKFIGLCGGTQEATSAKTGKPYKFTEFTEVGGSSMRSFRLFGDLNLPRNMVPQEYVLEAGIEQLADVKVLSSVASGASSADVKSQGKEAK